MRWSRTTFGLALAGGALLTAGCHSSGGSWYQMPHVFGKSSSDVKQVGHKEGDEADAQSPAMTAADAAYKEEQYEKAEGLFSQIADDTKQRPEVAERARFYHGECLRKQGYHPKAVDAYHKLLQDFPAGVYRGQAVGQMYAIAMDWLQPARDEILKKAGKLDTPAPAKPWYDAVVFVNFDRKLPTMDTEGRALQTLDRVYFNDPTGPFADKALFTLGQVNFIRGNFRESSKYFQQLVETNDKSPLRDEALQMAIITKNNSTGGPLYDGRDTSEAMSLIKMAKASSPKLVADKAGFLDQQAVAVRYQQAEKDFETAEFYLRTGHPGPAWFYYDLVIRRYPGIGKFAERAAVRQKELNADMDELRAGGANDPKWVWRKYMLGHQLPAVKPAADAPDLKELPPDRPAAVPAGGQGNVPADIRPR